MGRFAQIESIFLDKDSIPDQEPRDLLVAQIGYLSATLEDQKHVELMQDLMEHIKRR